MDIYLAKDWGAHMLRCRWKEILAKAVTETQERNPSQVTKMCPINKIDVPLDMFLIIQRFVFTDAPGSVVQRPGFHLCKKKRRAGTARDLGRPTTCP